MGYYYDDDFYTEPCEFDAEIESFKEALSKAIQEKFLNEMEELREENISLREFRDNKARYERELRAIKDEYQRKMQDAERQANQKKLKDILSAFAAIGYRATPEYKQRPKCDQCDDNRYIHFLSPMGRQMTEECSCAKRTCTYSPKDVHLLKFYVGKEIVDTYFERVDKSSDYDSYSLRAQIYDKNRKPFEDVNWFTTVFLQENDCQQFCNWLNEQEALKDAERGG